MDSKTIATIENIIKQGKVAEVKKERGNIVVVEIQRKAKSKQPMPPSSTEQPGTGGKS